MRPASAWPPIRSRALPRLILCLALAWPLTVQASAPVRIVDDRGRTVDLPSPARRIVALYGAFNEILADLGLADRLKARTDADASPPSLAALPSVGTHMRPNPELILGLSPDLVLQMSGRAEALESLAGIERRGVATAVFALADFDGLFSAVRRIGVLTGTGDRAEALVAGWQARLDRVAAAVSGRPRPRVFFEARSGNLLAAGRDSLVAEIVRRAGGVNCVEAEGRLVRLNEEELLRLAPDVLIVQRGPMNPDPAPPAARPRLRGLPALRDGRVFEVDEREFSRPGPGSVRAVERLAALLFPDANIPQGTNP